MLASLWKSFLCFHYDDRTVGWTEQCGISVLVSKREAYSGSQFWRFTVQAWGTPLSLLLGMEFLLRKA